MDAEPLESSYDLIRRVCKIANSSPDLKKRLQMVVDLVSEKLRTDACSVYLMEDDTRRLVLKATKGLHPEAVDHVALKLGEGITGSVALEKQTLYSSNAVSHPAYHYIPITGEEEFQSIISTPILSEGECIGVINVQTKERREFSANDIEILETLAEQLAGIIRSSHLYEKSVSALRDLTIIHEMGKRINATLNLSDLLQTLSQCSCEIVQADCSAVWLKETFPDKGFIKKCSFGPKTDIYMKQCFAIEAAPETTTASSSCVIHSAPLSPEGQHREFRFHCSLEPENQRKYLCFPLLSQSQMVGIVSIFREKPFSRMRHYSESETRLLSLLANQAGSAIDNAITHNNLTNLNTKSQNQLRELNILYESAKAMETSMNLDRCLKTILNAVTVGDGLGFNRAILLLLSEDGSTLQGMMGVGPGSPREAGEIWGRLSRQKTSDLYSWLTQRAEEPKENPSPFNELAKSLRIPIRPNGCVLSRTVREKRPFNIQNARKNENVNRELLEKLQCDSFAAVPLMANEKAVGVILVDNLYSGAPITETDLQFLSHFGGQAGLAIQNSSMFTKLEEVNRDLILTQKRLSESEHFAVLGELSAEIAHEIKNPLVPIGGFARRLLQKLEDSNPSHRYARIIVNEVARLECLLSNVLSYSKKIEPQFIRSNLNAVIEDVIHLMKSEMEEHQIRLICELQANLPETYFDPNQIRQVVTNLLSNSIESMAEGGGELRILTTARNEREIVFIVSDAGGGISEEVLQNIFNPFFTTKEKGTGIGLSLVKKIVENHHGKIGVENIVGIGVKSTVVLPYNLPKEGA